MKKYTPKGQYRVANNIYKSKYNKKYKVVGYSPDYWISPIAGGKTAKLTVRTAKASYNTGKKYKSKKKSSRRTSSPNRRISHTRRGGSSRYYYYRGKRYERKYKR